MTGALHLGHALTIAIEDAYVRAGKIRGERTTYIPGLDHAGIATQVVVEKMLAAKEGLSRHQLGREAFVARVHQWKTEVGDGRIREQMGMLGPDLDWDAEYFTLDPARSAAVNAAFVTLARQNLIYRDDSRLVNWCPTLRSAISDIEVDHVSVPPDSVHTLPSGASVPVGRLYSISYALAQGGDRDSLTVQTTRPETLLGDVALAVHPDDPRYARYIGSHVLHPLTRALLPVIGDSLAVQPEFGTGVLKISPGCDFTDAEVASRHNLPTISIVNEAGELALDALPDLDPDLRSALDGLDRFQARAAILDPLAAVGAYTGYVPSEQSLALCSRTGDVLEPVLRPQWFLSVRTMAQAAADAVASSTITLAPDSAIPTWMDWMANMNDWCLSRQLWWGHRIPAWRPDSDLEPADPSAWIFAASRKEAAALSGLPPETLVQDDDVLDTWFSSALLPLSVAGWPASPPDPRVYPLSLMETGSDILVFWVAKMVMLCTHLAPDNVPPFPHIDLHQMVRDKSGRKMSKSLGNVIDPADLIHGASLASLQDRVSAGNLDPSEQARSQKDLAASFPNGFAASGADALRFTLLDLTKQAHFINLDPAAVGTARRLCNKIWNGTRFVAQHVNDEARYTDCVALPQELEEDAMDTWILGKLDSALASFDDAVSPPFAMHRATHAVSSFFVDAFCDVYIEHIKTLSSLPPHKVALLQYAVSTFLIRAHPFLPHLTDELLTLFVDPSLPRPFPYSIPVTPRASANAPGSTTDVDAYVLPLLNNVRSLRAQFRPEKGKGQYIVTHAPSGLDADAVNLGHQLISHLSKAESVRLDSDLSSPTPSEGTRLGSVEFAVEGSMVTVTLFGPQAVQKSQASVEETQARIAKLTRERAKLVDAQSRPEYADRVPSHIQERHSSKIQELESKITLLQSS